MAVTKEVNRPALTGRYDRRADVLYIAVGEPRQSEGEDLANGIVVRYPFDDPGHAWAITVVGYKAHAWHRHINDLAKEVAELLKVNRIKTAALIHRITGKR